MFIQDNIGRNEFTLIEVQNASYITIACVAVLFCALGSVQVMDTARTTSKVHLRKHSHCIMQPTVLLNFARIFQWVNGQGKRAYPLASTIDEKP